MADTLIYCVDGFNPRVVKVMTDAGKMPNLKKLQDRDGATYGSWESMVTEESGLELPETGPCWNTIYTGVEPSEHGITEGGWHDGDSNFDGIYTVWDKLSEQGIEMALWGLMMSYPAKKLNGFMMSGFVAPSGATGRSLFWNKDPEDRDIPYFVYPAELLDELPDDAYDVTTSHVAKSVIGGAAPDREIEPRFPKMVDAEERRLEIFLDLLDNRMPEDIVAYGTTLADKVGHIDSIVPGREYTTKTYEKVDDMLGKLLEKVDPENVVVLSDHGFDGFQHSMQGYYLNTAGAEFQTIFDFAPFILSHYKIEYDKEEYGHERDSVLSEEEKETMRERLDELGYLG